MTRFIISLGFLAITAYKCGAYKPSRSEVIKGNREITENDIRLIPWSDSLSYLRDSSISLLKIYAIDIDVDTLTPNMRIFLDDYVCKLYNKKFKHKYPRVVLNFLKETDETRAIKDRGISDSNNPISDSHFKLAMYVWQDNEFWKREYNENMLYYRDFECK